MRNETVKDINLERLKRGKPIRTSHGYVTFVDDPEKEEVSAWFTGTREQHVIGFPGPLCPPPVTAEKIKEISKLMTPDLYERYKDFEPYPIKFRKYP